MNKVSDPEHHMAEQGIPPAVPAATAAILTGVSYETFRARFIETELVATSPTPGRIMVDVASLERATGKEITCVDLCMAERERDRRRGYQRNYRAAYEPAPPAVGQERPTKSVRPPTGRALRNLRHAP